ncbi:MAG: insulinase family protein [Candidatus Omnitrophica bacterium]|nr:insulinase family protein [Candidatus Omnitrophota bacterium]MBU4478153.1 insulinase family protein [Candidatus Omnitrophota bacterium]MCG2704050.1 insulinase family protein [Candidatus Omnitrophota bacterium]
MYKITTGENRTKILTCFMPKVNSVAVGVWAGVGGRYEDQQVSGISHFFEHMVFKGTKNRDYRGIKEAIEGVGGMLNAFTAEELTCFIAKVLCKHLPVAVDVLLDMVVNPLLKPADVEKERRVISEEIKMYFDLPHHLAYDRLIQLLWPNHPLGRNLAGSFETLKNIDRQKLLNFKTDYYNPNNIIVAVCGNVKHDHIVFLADEFFRKNKMANEKAVKSTFPAADCLPAKTQVDFIKKDTQQSHLCLGLHSFRRDDPARHALMLLHIILGANMSSRLFNEVREKKGYAYEIGTAMRRYADTGAFLVYAGIVNKNAEAAVEVILRQLRKICRESADKEELKRAKEYYTGHLLMGLEDTLEHMVWMGEQYMCETGIKPAGEIIADIEKVTMADIQAVARRIFRKARLSLVIVATLKHNQEKTITDLIRGFMP